MRKGAHITATRWSFRRREAWTSLPLRKGHRLLKNIPDMDLAVEPKVPTWAELQRRARQFPPRHVHERGARRSPCTPITTGSLQGAGKGWYSQFCMP